MNEVFKAIADTNRRKIISLLKKKDMNVSQLLENFDITQASLSHHLDILKRADLVVSERKGQNIYYSLNISVFEQLVEFIYNFFDKNEKL